MREGERERERESAGSRATSRERVRERPDGRERGGGREGEREKERNGDSPGDRHRDRGSDRDRQYTLTQRPSKQVNIELNKQLMRISDTRELCDFVSTHAAEFNQVNVATAFRQVLKKTMGIPPKALAQALQTLEESALQNMQDFGAQDERGLEPPMTGKYHLE